MTKSYAALWLVLAMVGCGRQASPVAPGPPSNPTQPPPTFTSATFRVISGWDRTPVIGATVRFGNDQLTTDETGSFRFVFDPPRTTLTPEPVDIDAAGFLPHKLMRARQAGGDITMWPVASDADADAIRAMAFYQSRNGYELSRAFVETGRYLLAFQPGADINFPDVAQRWRDAYSQFGELIGLPLDLGGTSPDDDHLIVSFDATAESCSDVWGFCDSYLREDNSGLGTGRAGSPRASLTGVSTPHCIVIKYSYESYTNNC